MLRNAVPISPLSTSEAVTSTPAPFIITGEPVTSTFLNRYETVDFLRNQSLTYFNTTFDAFENCNGTNCLDYFSPTDTKDILVDVYQEKNGEIVRLVLFFISHEITYQVLTLNKASSTYHRPGI